MRCLYASTNRLADFLWSILCQVKSLKTPIYNHSVFFHIMSFLLHVLPRHYPLPKPNRVNCQWAFILPRFNFALSYLRNSHKPDYLSCQVNPELWGRDHTSSLLWSFSSNMGNWDPCPRIAALPSMSRFVADAIRPLPSATETANLTTSVNGAWFGGREVSSLSYCNPKPVPCWLSPYSNNTVGKYGLPGMT